MILQESKKRSYQGWHDPICIRPLFQQKNTIPEFFKTVRLANTFSNIKVCLDLEQDWASLLKKGREKASPARDDGTSWTDGLWYKREGRGRCPPGLDTQGTSPTPLWDRVFISFNLSCLRCWPVGFCQQRWLGSSSDPRHSSPLTKEDYDQKHKCSYSVGWSMLTPWTPACSMQFLTSCRLWMLPFAITGTCKQLIVRCDDLEGEEMAPSQHP